MGDTEIDNTEAMLDKQPTASKQVYVFKKPVTVNGTTYTELKLDFESVDGNALEVIEDFLAAQGKAPQIKEFSKAYLMHVVAAAAKINVNDVKSLPANHITALTLRAQAFLMSAV